QKKYVEDNLFPDRAWGISVPAKVDGISPGERNPRRALHAGIPYTKTEGGKPLIKFNENRAWIAGGPHKTGLRLDAKHAAAGEELPRPTNDLRLIGLSIKLHEINGPKGAVGNQAVETAHSRCDPLLVRLVRVVRRRKKG